MKSQRNTALEGGRHPYSNEKKRKSSEIIMSLFDKFKKKSKSDEVQIKDFTSTEEIKEHLLGDILPATLACQVQR